MSKLRDFDMNQLLLMLHGELRLAFNAAQSAEKETNLRVESVNIKMGQKSVSGSGEEPENVSLLDAERYPDEEDWQVSLRYRYGDPIPDIPGSLMWFSSATSGLVLDRLKSIPVKDIKGVDRVWETILHQANILTIEDLADIPNEKIRELCRAQNSLFPLEFQTKVLMLAREFNPLKFPEYYNISLTVFLLQSNQELKKLFGGKLSEPEISSLKAMASIVCLVIDKRAFNSLKLGLFAPAV
jgi:hypothetical protein